ncbi:Glycerol kinase [compost metagenome]
MRTIGIDIGTTSITGMVYDLKQHRVLHQLTEENSAHIPGSGKEWERLQDPSAILHIVQGILHQLLSRAPEVLGIGLTGQMHGIVYTDAAGEHVSPLYTWQDGRGKLPYNEFLTHAEKLSEETGYPVSPGYGLATHFYNLRHGLVPSEAKSFCTIADYAAMRLADRTVPLMDSTQAAGIGGYSIPNGAFDQVAIERAGIPADLLPRVVQSGTLVGLTRTGVPVYTSLGDNQASFLGSVPFPEEALLLNIGTGSQLSVMLTDSDSTAEGLEARPYPGGGVLIVGAALSGGKSYALLEKFYRQVIEAYTGQPQGDMYPLLDKLLGDGPVSTVGLTVNPQFLGTRVNPEARGSVEGITLDNFTPGLLTHAFLQGITDELYAFYKSIEKMSSGKTWTGLIGSGNALRANPALCKTVEARFGLPLILSAASEEAAVGAALCAAVGAGVIGSFQETGQYLG